MNINDIILDAANAIVQHNEEKQAIRNKDGYIHISDIVHCPRKTAFQKLDDKYRINTSAMFYFLIGEAIHEKLQDLLVKTYPNRYSKEKVIKLEGGIIAHVDLYNTLLDAPVEIKTTTKTEKKLKEPDPTHVKQLKYYLALLFKNKGILQYFLYTESPANDNKFINPDSWFKSFEITLSNQEMDTIRARIKSDANSLRRALLTSDPSLANHIYLDDKENENCKYCPYAIECYQMVSKKKTDNITYDY